MASTDVGPMTAGKAEIKEAQGRKPKGEPKSEHIEIRKLDNGYLVSHSKHYEGKDGLYREPERRESYHAEHPMKMLSDVKGMDSALTKNERAPAKLPGGEPDKAVRKAASTGGPSKAPPRTPGEKTGVKEGPKGEKMGVKVETKKPEMKKPETMAEYAKRREKETMRKKK